jgi:hypothetical protein
VILTLSLYLETSSLYWILKMLADFKAVNLILQKQSLVVISNNVT